MPSKLTFENCILLLTLVTLSACNSGGNHNNGNAGASGDDLSTSIAEKVQTAYYKNLHGKLDGKSVTLQLTKSQDHYSGVFFYDTTARPFTVSGDEDSDGNLSLVTYQQYTPLDTFQGTFPQPGVFQGTWSDSSHSRPVAFTMQEIYPEGTSDWQVFNLFDSLLLRPADSNSQKARIQYTLLWPGKKWPVAQQTLVQQSITHDLLHIHTTVSGVNELLKNMADSFFTAYRTIRTDMPDSLQKTSASMNWESDTRMELLWNADNIVSLACNTYEYTGGAHGLGSTHLIVWDLNKLKTLTLTDIFKENYKKPLQAILEEKLRQGYDIPADVPLNDRRKGILFDKELALTSNFYLTGKGIGFIYNPYEVAPYVVGPIELFIPFSELIPVLKPGFAGAGQ